MAAEENPLERRRDEHATFRARGIVENGGRLPNSEQDDSVMQTRVANLLDDITEMNDSALYKPEDGAPNPTLSSVDSTSAGQASDAPPAYLFDPAGEQSNVRIRGRNDGLAIEIGPGEWPELLTHLDERLEQSANFFRGGNVALLASGRHMDEASLFQVRELLDRFSLTLGVVRTSSQRTFDAALAVGLAATLEGEEVDEPVVAHPAESNDELRSHFVYRGNLRSGQLLHRQESVLVIGDVNPGSNVISHGDILVWGRLRGVAHAGAGGDEECIIGALSFEPIQLRIGELIAIAPTSHDSNTRAEAGQAARIAYVADERIVVADWTEARRNGRSVLRR